MAGDREADPDRRGESPDSAREPDTPDEPTPLQSRHEPGIALSRSVRHRVELEAALADVRSWTELEKGTEEAKRYVAELRKELELNKRREADLLGALNVTREEKAWLEEGIRTIEGDPDDAETVRAPAKLPSEIGAPPAPSDPDAAKPPPRRIAPERKAIEVRDVSKAFTVPVHRTETLKEQIIHPFRSREAERLQALDAVSFDVGKGEFLGITGANGSGKSTLLKILAGIYAADTGTVRMAGRVAPFIELGAGFNPELTAYDNVILSGVMMGLEPDEARARYDQVIAFAGLEEFTEMKLRNYSSGMHVRLTFSVMAQVDADILLIDEVLAVGDAEFQQKCLARLHELRSAGKTIVLVTHDMHALATQCDHAILLEHGRIAREGDPAQVAEHYHGTTPGHEESPRAVAPPRRRPKIPRDNARPRAAAATIAAALVAAAALSLGGGDLARGMAAMLGVAAAFAAVPLPTTRRRDRLLAIAGLLTGTWLWTALCIEAIPDLVNPVPSVADAVGGAAYFGTPYMGAQIAAVASIALLVGAAVVGAIRRGTVVRASPAPERGLAPADPAARPRRRDARLAAGGAGLVAFSLVPDLRDYVHGATQPLVSNWDSANILVWDYLINQGLTPMGDFFYPYGFQWLFALFPAGPVWTWLAQSALIGLAAWALWRLSGGRPIPVVLCLAVLAVYLAANPFAVRYFAALMIPITYSALGPARHRRLTSGHAAFGAACGLAAFWEADLLLFGAAGAGLVLVGEICSGRLGWEPRTLARGLAIDCVPVGIAVAALAAAWLATGTADGNAHWFLGLGANSAFAAPNQVAGGTVSLFSAWPSITSIQVILPTLLAAAGLLHAIFGQDRNRGVSPILLSGSGVLLVLLLKDLVRPAAFALLVGSVVLLWAAILLWRPRSLGIAAAIGVFLGGAFVTLEKDRTGALGYLGDAVVAPVSAVRSIALGFDSDAVADASRERFDIERFVGSPDLAAAREYLAVTDGRADATFAVLGDAQLMYPIFRRNPPYHAQLWDASPIHEQRAMVEALAREEPSLLVWRRDFSWDGVPYHVRNPLVFGYAVDNYVPVRRGSTSDVLRRRRAGEPIAASYWRRRLGTTVDLGFIPALSDGESAPPCTGGEDCAAYAVLDGAQPETGKTVTIRLRGTRGDFEVALRTLEGTDRYPIRLDRLWFWPLLGDTPKITSDAPEWSVRRTSLRSTELY